MLVVRESAEAREDAWLRWDLIPSWSRKLPKDAGFFNARSESVAEKPSFRDSFRRRRCLIPADGFYEWQKTAGGKRPYFFHMRDEEPFALAGLLDRWRGPAGEEIESCTILTTAPNDLVALYHDRMPVILDAKDYELWLHAGVTKTERLSPLLRPYPAERMGGAREISGSCF